VPAPCAHGLPAADCLICRTLGTPATTAEQPRRQRRRDAPAAGTVQVLGPGRTVPADRRRQGSLAGRLVLFSLALVGLALAMWVVVGAVFAVFHLIELVAVALLAGWLGYRLGHARGRHQSRG